MARQQVTSGTQVVGHVRPATSMVEVRRLITPEVLVEIEADAIVGAGQALPGAPAR